MEYISEQQQAVVESSAKYRLINGCAGSHKTDTLIKCAIQFIHTHSLPVLFLTLVGSVTDEIRTRVGTRLGVTIEKQGMTNHYSGRYRDTSICISNYDAWVHKMMEDDVDIMEYGDCYSEKVDRLNMRVSRGDNTKCVTKRGDIVGLLLIDEVQDLDADKMNIIIQLTHSHPELYICVAGDYLQTLYINDISTDIELTRHSMNIFKTISPEYHNMNICMRCPKAHVDFVNMLLEDIQQKHMVPPMIPNNTNIIDKPVLFTHYATSDNTSALLTARQITNMIDELMTHDTTIVPNDIAIIMAKSRNNWVYAQLLTTLSKLYREKGYTNHVCHMNTDFDGKHKALDWESVSEKTKMLSIHGDKGRGHRVVFLLGVSEWSLPQKQYIGKPSEIIPDSLINVGLTRSTQYLFVGFNHFFPSRYLYNKRYLLHNHAYLSWATETILSIPEPYRSIIDTSIQEIPEGGPRWPGEYKNKSPFGNRQSLPVTDIAKAFQDTKQLVSYKWKPNKITEVFGNIQQIFIPLQDNQYPILGIMAEILIRRTCNGPELFEEIREYSNPDTNIYTDDERLISCMHDFRCHKYDIHTIDEYFKRYSHFFKRKENTEIREKIRQTVSSYKNVAHTIFNTEHFRANLEEFLSTTPNNELSTTCIWNVTLFYIQTTQLLYEPSINEYYGYFTQNISTIHDNIEIYIHEHLHGHLVRHEQPVTIRGKLTTSELSELGLLERDHGGMSLSGRYDIYTEDNATLFEIKTSSLKDCSTQWINQIALYAQIMDCYKIQVNTLIVVNILAGTLWKWDISEVKLPSLKDSMHAISKKYEWHPFELSAIIRGIPTTI